MTESVQTSSLQWCRITIYYTVQIFTTKYNEELYVTFRIFGKYSWCNSVLRTCLEALDWGEIAALSLLADKGLVNVWDDSTPGNGRLDQRVQLLVPSDGQLQNNKLFNLGGLNKYDIKCRLWSDKSCKKTGLMWRIKGYGDITVIVDKNQRGNTVGW